MLYYCDPNTVTTMQQANSWIQKIRVALYACLSAPNPYVHLQRPST